MPLDTEIPVRFLASAFDDDDLIAIAFRRLPRQSTPATGWEHRFVRAEAARRQRFLGHLRFLNAHGHDIYVSMNVFGCRRNGRTEENVTMIRHVYADFDSGGATALAALRTHAELPPPSYVVHSSRGKFQAIWNVCNFQPAYAKRLLRHLAYTLGADTAVHDLNRVLRLPGFYNYKYDPPQFVRLEMGPSVRREPDEFPVPPDDETRPAPATVPRAHVSRLPGTTKTITRSDRDWATVRTALAHGRPWQDVKVDLMAARQDKPNPTFYACLTVLNALMSLGLPEPRELVVELHASKARGRTSPR